MKARFIAIAKDPSIIPGVHHHCDEWCDYCPVPERCLSFRCTAAFRQQHRRREADSTFASMDQAVAFTRELAMLEGSSTAELDALLADRAVQASKPRIPSRRSRGTTPSQQRSSSARDRWHISARAVAARRRRRKRSWYGITCESI
jgi:hypothetical protein